MAAEQIIWRVGKGGGAKTARPTVDDGARPAASDAAASRSDVKFQFVSIDSGDGLCSATSRTKTRAHVAKETRARQRRERMLQHQEKKRQECDHDATLTAPVDPQRNFDSMALIIQRDNNAVFIPFSPMTLLSASPVDPFDSAARPMSMFDHYLLLHCKFLHWYHTYILLCT
jgi:hypothetical protein